MVLKLQRRAEAFEAYSVASHDFQIGGIWRLGHVQVELWGWCVGNVNLNADGHGPCQGGAGNRQEAMEMLARRWRIWLRAAGLREVNAPHGEENARPPARSDMATAGLMLKPRNDGPSEGYRVESNGVPLGAVGRTYGVDTTRWYWSLSAIAVPVDERARGVSHPYGGGVTREKAFAGLTASWRAWLTVAGLEEIPADT